MRTNATLGFLILFALLALILLNELNVQFISPNYPYKSGLITTADEYSYFSPAEQFYNTGEWDQNKDGEAAYIRTPGYGIVYFIALVIGHQHSFFVLKVLQILLFGGSIYLLFVISRMFFKPSLSLSIAFIYAFLPCYSGFVYYTLSEAILPFFLFLWVYSILTPKRKWHWYELAMSSATLVIIRPQLIVFPVLLCAYFLIQRNRTFWALLVGFLPILLWNVRTTFVLGEWPGIHPIYSTTNNTLYRPPHKAMTDLFRVWEYRGDVFHENMGLLSIDTTHVARIKVLQTIPIEFHQAVEPVLLEFQHFRYLQATAYNGKKLSGYLPGERQLVKSIQMVKTHLQSQHLFTYWIKTPVQSFKQLIGTSMMNLYVFQATWKDSIIVICLKWICFLSIFCGFLSTCYQAIWDNNTRLQLIAISVLVSVFYLVFFQRMNEERYLYPYLGLFLFFAFKTIHHLSFLLNTRSER
jgi:hypothetical protein